MLFAHRVERSINRDGKGVFRRLIEISFFLVGLSFGAPLTGLGGYLKDLLMF